MITKDDTLNVFLSDTLIGDINSILNLRLRAVKGVNFEKVKPYSRYRIKVNYLNKLEKNIKVIKVYVTYSSSITQFIIGSSWYSNNRTTIR